jgi:hypothetical protein
MSRVKQKWQKNQTCSYIKRPCNWLIGNLITEPWLLMWSTDYKDLRKNWGNLTWFKIEKGENKLPWICLFKESDLIQNTMKNDKWW